MNADTGPLKHAPRAGEPRFVERHRHARPFAGRRSRQKRLAEDEIAAVAELLDWSEVPK